MQGEEQTIVTTRSRLKGAKNNIPPAIEVLLQLIYFNESSKDINSPEGEFHSYCWHQYIDVPYSFRACYILWERGYYLESTIIIRSLLEKLIQLRYLDKHKNLITSIWSGVKVKGEFGGRHTQLSLTGGGVYPAFCGALRNSFCPQPAGLIC